MNHKQLRTKPIPLELITLIVTDCGPSGYVVYSVLLCHAKTTGKGKGGRGTAYPSEELIAEEGNISTRTVIRSVKLLIQHRYIMRTKHPTANGRFNNVYWIAYIRIGDYVWPPTQEVSDNLSVEVLR